MSQRTAEIRVHVYKGYVTGKTPSGGKIHQWRDPWPDSDKGEQRHMGTECGVNRTAADFKPVEVDATVTIEYAEDHLCRKCFWDAYHQTRAIRSRKLNRYMEGRTCQTCIGYLQPRWDCIDCGGTGKSSKPKATPI